MTALTFERLLQSINGKFGIHDISCPLCGPERRSPSIESGPSCGFGTYRPISFLLFARGVARRDLSAIGMRPRSTRSLAPASVRSWNTIERQALRKDCARLWRSGAHVSHFAVRLQRNICARLEATTLLFRRRSVFCRRATDTHQQ